MATNTDTLNGVAPPLAKLWRRTRYWLGHWKLSLGLALVLSLVLFWVIGSLFVDRNRAEMMWGPVNEPPSPDYPLGTEGFGRDMLSLMVYGIPTSLAIGFLAGGIGTSVGTVLGLMTGYYRGYVDSIIRTMSDILLTIPSLLILILIAAYMRSTTVAVTGLIIAFFAWSGPLRSIRAQTLSMREWPFIPMAKLSGRSDFEIILLDILPNLLPYIMSGFVGSVSGAILASVGIQLLGVGPLHIPNLGMILQFAFKGAALYRGMWWWWAPPSVALVVLFVGLFLISMGLDEYANPRLRAQGF